MSVNKIVPEFSAVSPYPEKVSTLPSNSLLPFARLATLMDRVILGLMLAIVLTLAWPVSLTFRGNPHAPVYLVSAQSLPRRVHMSGTARSVHAT